MQTLRTFIALELPDDVKEHLGGLQRELQRQVQQRHLLIDQSLKWVAVDGIHLTLKFLGSVGTGLLGDLESAIREAGAERPAPRLLLSGLGAFPSSRQPRVLWVGLAGDLAQVAELQRRVEENLVRLGFAPERRQFSPHVTLARVREQAAPADRLAVGRLLAAGVSAPELEFTADRLSLMKSELRPTGARYEALFTVHLGR